MVGPFGPGCRFHIVEAFQARPEFLQDRLFDVPKLDRTGFRLELRRFGVLLAGIDKDGEERLEGMGWRVTKE